MTIEVQRSGDLYLVSSGDTGRLIDAATGWAGPRGTVESILAHCNAYDPWESVAVRDCPRAVLAAMVRKSAG